MLCTWSCISSQTRLRSATDGWLLPSKNLALPLSQKVSRVDRDLVSICSASAAAFESREPPRNGARTLFITYPAEIVKQYDSIPNMNNIKVCSIPAPGRKLEWCQSKTELILALMERTFGYLMNEYSKRTHVDLRIQEHVSKQIRPRTNDQLHSGMQRKDKSRWRDCQMNITSG